MKNYKATDHAKLSTKDLQDRFTKFMLNEYNGYVNDGDSTAQTALVIEADKATFQAHHDGDFDWFVSEFFRDLKRKTLKDYSELTDKEIVELVCDCVLQGKKAPKSLQYEITKRNLA